MRRAIVTALAMLLGMCLGAAVSETRLRTVFVLSEASHISHGAAAARLLFGFTLDPLPGKTSVYNSNSVSYTDSQRAVYKFNARFTRFFEQKGVS
jgi:hypothetical protein